MDGSPLRRVKPLLLLAFLALEGPRDRRYLSELFWPQATRPRTNLRVALAKIRTANSSALIEQGARLSAQVELDAAALLQLVDSGAPDLLEAYEGAFLQGVDSSGFGVELEEWVFSTREFIAEQVVFGLLGRAERLIRRGESAAAAELAWAAYSLPGAPALEKPQLEAVYRLLVTAGSTRSALIAREAGSLGVRLSVEAGSNGEAQPPLPPNNLSTARTSFVGRDPELIALAELLRLPDVRLVNLMGPGGNGKSRLALQAARQELRTGNWDGVYAVEIFGLQESGALPTTIAAALGIALSGKAEPLAELSGRIADKRLLLLLDNFEHLLNAAGQVPELLSACPQLRILVTSRERLALPEEQLFPVGGLPLPPSARLDPERTAVNDSLRLFEQRACRGRPDFGLDPGNIRLVLEICRLVEGSPLAIELAASSLRLMSLPEIEAELRSGAADFLADPALDAPARQRSLRATFEHSWRLLGDQQKDSLASLALFQGSFSRRGAAQIADATIPRLAALIDSSLVRPLPDGRYRLHPLIGQFCREKLSRRPPLEARVLDRFVSYYVALAEEWEPLLGGSQQAAGLGELDAEQDNLRLCLNQLQANGQVVLLLRCSAALERFWRIRGQLSEGRQRLHAALSLPRPADADEARAKALNRAGDLAFAQGDHASARSLLEEALELQRSTGDAIGTASTLHALGTLATVEGKFGRAEELLAQALRLHRQRHNLSGVAASLNNLGNLARRQRRFPLAKAYYQECLDILRSLGDRRRTAEVLNGLANLARAEGDRQAAIALYREGLAIKRELGDLPGVALSLNNLGVVLSEEGEPEAARPLLQQSLDIRRQLGDRRGVGTTLHHLGNAERKLGNRRLGDELLAEGLATSQAVNDLVAVAYALGSVAEWAVADGDHERAARLFGAAAFRWDTVGAPGPEDGRDEQARNQARRVLGEDLFETLYHSGRECDVDELFERAYRDRVLPREQ